MSKRNKFLADLFTMHAKYPGIACYPTSEIIELWEAGLIQKIGAWWSLTDDAWQQ